MGKQSRRLAAAASAFFLLQAVPVENPAAAEPVTLSLDEALATVLRNNLDLANAVIETDKAEKGLSIVERRRLPEVTLDGSYVRLETPESLEVLPGDLEASLPPGLPAAAFETRDSDADTALRAQMPLYTGGRISAAGRQAAVAVQIAREAERRTRDDLLLETATAFYDLLAAQILEEIAREGLEGSRLHLADVEALLARGVVAKADLYRTELDLAERERDLAAAEAGIVRRSEHLSSLLFPDTYPVLRARREVPEPEELPPVEAWAALAEKSSPEIASARLGIDLAGEGVAAAKAERLPALGLFGAWGARAEDFSYGSEDRYWNAGLSLAFPLYRGGRTLLEIERSRNTEDQALNSLALVTRQVRRGIVDARAGAVLGLQQAAAASKAIVSAEENLRVTRLKYREGLVTNTDVIDALLSLSRARFDRVEALRNYHVGRAQLMRLAGTVRDLVP